MTKRPAAGSFEGPTLDLFERAAMRIPFEIIAQYNPDFVPPEQERTRLKTARIMAVTICLLMEREFSEISVMEIARKAGCSITTVYARFRDKEALIPAVQYVISYVYFKQLDDVIAKASGPDKTVDAFIGEVLTMFDGLFSRHRYFFKAGMTGENKPFHRHTDDMMETLSARIHQGVLQTRGGEAVTKDSVWFALRVIMSVFRDRAIAGNIMTFPDTPSLSRLAASIMKNRLTA